MRLDPFLDNLDAMMPNAYTSAQKTAWVSDLEAIVWTQICLQPAGLWHPYRYGRDGRGRLFLPDSWQRVYTAYLGAMMQFANGEYNQYENAMTLYNGYMGELGAWYAQTFDPASHPARWVRWGTVSAQELTQGKALGYRSPDGALLGVELRLTEPLDGNGTVSIQGVDSGETLFEVDIMQDNGGVLLCSGLVLPGRCGECLEVCYDGESLSQGQMELWALTQDFV
jgi:hypothetical protein